MPHDRSCSSRVRNPMARTRHRLTCLSDRPVPCPPRQSPGPDRPAPAPIFRKPVALVEIERGETLEESGTLPCRMATRYDKLARNYLSAGAIMKHYAGSDLSMESTQVCIVDENGWKLKGSAPPSSAIADLDPNIKAVVNNYKSYT